MTGKALLQTDIAGLSAIDVGAGPGLLLLHGVGLQAQVWAPQVRVFRHTHRVIAPDMPGHGQSAPPKPDPALADYVDAARAVLEALPGQVAVVGHSMGAMIAMELAAKVPEKVQAVVALNAIFERSAEAARAVRARAAALQADAPPDPGPTLTRWFGMAPSAERDACDQMLRGVDPRSYKQAYTVFARENGPSRAALRNLICPALFATGAEEPNSTPAMSRAMADLAPQGQALVIEGAAHMMPLTHAPAVNAALGAFLQQGHP